MPKVLTLRPLTEDETRIIGRLAHSRTESARAVERAQIIWQARSGARVPAIAQTLGMCEATVRLWLTRFNAGGVDGLRDGPRAGRPPTYSPEEVGEVIAASLTKPDDLDLPFGSWTLDRLAAYLQEHKGVAISRSRIGRFSRRRGYAGGPRRRGSASESIPRSSKKGGDRRALRGATSRWCRSLPG